MTESQVVTLEHVLVYDPDQLINLILLLKVTLEHLLVYDPDQLINLILLLVVTLEHVLVYDPVQLINLILLLLFVHYRCNASFRHIPNYFFVSIKILINFDVTEFYPKAIIVCSENPYLNG